MQCFKVPKKVCNEINAEIAKFGWRQQLEEKKIHWLNWLELTDLEILACSIRLSLQSSVGRLLQHPDSYWTRIFKGRYFPDCTILEARKGSRASWVWASLLEGRDFLKENIIWQHCGKDRMVWPHCLSGQYTVKEGYHLLKKKEEGNRIKKPSSSHCVDEKLWKIIWSLKTLPKVKMFLWRACTLHQNRLLAAHFVAFR
ncbi:hypothetical protein V6Z11_D10G045200 [Gossypium hirsutum]